MSRTSRPHPFRSSSFPTLFLAAAVVLMCWDNYCNLVAIIVGIPLLRHHRVLAGVALALPGDRQHRTAAGEPTDGRNRRYLRAPTRPRRRIGTDRRGVRRTGAAHLTPRARVPAR
ncbi:hypothetical protein EF294_14985 [Gordonia oryzae]|uniref:Uncharacterized protein n=1 Tax=Gordonia oryzae TaxID=2487349 RepID=A0A3N4G6S8_9ACTN|nr:hypothetical protein EF294_14985 [Gordonia oryzae]